MSAENLLQRLDKVKRIRGDKWQACCPAHNDKSPSLVVREMDDGRVLIHCFAGCGAAEILDAVGLDFTELYPPKATGQYLPKVRKPWSASDVLSALAMEVLIAWNYAKKMANNEVLSCAERERLLRCATRLQRGLEVVHG